MTPTELLRVYDDQVRRPFLERLPAGWTGERDGPLVRCTTNRDGFAMLTHDAADLAADDLDERVHGDEGIHVFVVEDGDTVVSAAWIVLGPGPDLAGLWGGSTLASHRGRGIYRALVARRAQLAVDLGYSYLQVDASDDSRPILERLGLTVIGGTTPYSFGAR